MLGLLKYLGKKNNMINNIVYFHIIIIIFIIYSIISIISIIYYYLYFFYYNAYPSIFLTIYNSHNTQPLSLDT